MIRPRPLDPLCPACRRFIGMTTRCPFCGAESRHRRPVMLLRCAASVLSVGGILLLLLFT